VFQQLDLLCDVVGHICFLCKLGFFKGWIIPDSGAMGKGWMIRAVFFTAEHAEDAEIVVL
jgi:hypothetical protein